MTFDDARARHPTLAMTLYALTPGGDVTLEIIAPDGEIFTFPGATAEAALALAFPEPAELAGAFE